jgi:hypothetical protein
MPFDESGNAYVVQWKYTALVMRRLRFDSERGLMITDTEVINRVNEGIYKMLDEAYGVEEAQIIHQLMVFRLHSGEWIKLQVSTYAPPKPPENATTLKI